MIRPATRDDASAVARINHLGWTVFYAPFLAPALMPAAEEPAEWADRIGHPNYRTLVWDHDGELLGFVSAGRTEAADAEAEGTGIVLALYVDPAAQGRGIGSALLDAGLEHMREIGLEQAILWTFVDNARARAFYERRGWTPEPWSIEPHFQVQALEVRYRRPL